MLSIGWIIFLGWLTIGLIVAAILDPEYSRERHSLPWYQSEESMANIAPYVVGMMLGPFMLLFLWTRKK